MLTEVTRPTKRCHASGRELQAGEEYFAVLVENPAGLQRQDYSKAAWAGPPEGTYAYWRGRLPADNAPATPKPIAVEDLLAFFESLGSEASRFEKTQKNRLRYVLALLLVRRRALKLHSIRKEGERDILVVRPHDSSETIEIPDPRLSDSEIQAVENELQTWMTHREPATSGASGPCA